MLQHRQTKSLLAPCQTLVLICAVLFCLVLSIMPSLSFADDGDLTKKCTFMANNNISSPAGPPTVPRTKPIKADWPGINITETCDQLLPGQEVCCNASQVYKLQQNWKLIEQSFYTCEACQISFKRLWCGFVCSPYQGHFVKITGMDGEHVDSVEFIVSNQFGQGIWQSCKDTRMGAGPINSIFGSYKDFLKMAEQPFPPHTPTFNISYQDYNPKAEISGFDTPTLPCQGICGCGSCLKTCPSFTSEPCKLFGMRCPFVGYIAMSVVGGVALVAFSFGVGIRVYDLMRARFSPEHQQLIS